MYRTFKRIISFAHKKTLFSQENHKNKIEKNYPFQRGPLLVLIAIINSDINWWVFFIYLIQKRRLKRDSYYGLHAIANMQKAWKRHRRIADLKLKPSHDNAPSEERGVKNITISIYPESLPPLSKTNNLYHHLTTMPLMRSMESRYYS
jgi:hypothetical protein